MKTYATIFCIVFGLVCSTFLISQQKNNTAQGFSIIRGSNDSGYYMVPQDKQQPPLKGRFDPQRFDKELRIHKKIEAQQQQMQKLYQAQEKAKREHQRRQVVKEPTLQKIKFMGKETQFYEGPRLPRTTHSRFLTNALTSNVLINGKQVDTIFAGDPFTLSFSLAPNTISAVVNIYVDMNHNGSIDSSDIPVVTNGLVFDNGEDDQDPAVGQCLFKFRSGDFISGLLSTLIFEVNDFQSVSSATLTIKEKKGAKVIVGTITPVFKNTLVEFYSYISNNNYWYRIVFPDTTGNVTVQIDTSIYQAVSVYVFDITKTPDGYLPPRDTSLIIEKDTTRFAMSYRLAKEFIEGYVKDQNGDPIKNAHVSAWINCGYRCDYVQVNTVTDSGGYYKVGARTGDWYVYFDPPSATEEYLRKNYSYSHVTVGANQTVRKDYSFLKSNSSISGTVKYGVNGVGGVPISAGSDSLYNHASTTASGNYILKVFKPNAGTYTYSVNAYVNYYSGYYIDSSYRPNISPGAANVDFTMKKIFGGVQGRITDNRTGEPIKNASGHFSGPSYRSFSSDDSGYYRVRLLDGHYSLYVNADYYEYYNDNNVVISGTILTKNIALVRTGSFSGTVKDESGNPIPGVSIYGQDTVGYNYYVGYTDGLGKYAVSGLNTASYKALANKSGYIPQWYNKKSVMDSATAINVVKGFDTPNIDFVLSRGGSISGTVKDKMGKGIPNIAVYVLDTMSMYSVAYAQTDDSGKYVASGLFTGKYFVVTWSNDYLEQWYNGASSYLAATKVPVTIYQNTPNINFTLSAGGIISGKVLDKLGNPIIGAEVTVLDTNYYYLRYGQTNDSGQYVIKKLTSGVKLYMRAQAFRFSQRWYDNVATPELATPIVLQTEEVRGNVDFTLPAAGKISGTVKNKAGTTIPFANINAVRKNGGWYYASSDQSGNYVLQNLDAGKYIVSASHYDYALQYYDHKSKIELADSVVVEEEKTTNNINFNLSTGGRITGTVRTVTGSPIANASVYAINNNQSYGFYGSSDQSGAYTIQNIFPGIYIISASHYEYFPQWYDHKSSMQLADTMVVEEEKTASNINFDLKQLPPPSYDSIIIRLSLANIPDTLVFSKTGLQDYYVDYWWGVRMDIDNNPSTGPQGGNGCEFELTAFHYKVPGEQEYKSNIIDGTFHVLIEWIGNVGYWRHTDVVIAIDQSDKKTLIIKAPKHWPELDTISSSTRYYIHTFSQFDGKSGSDNTVLSTAFVPMVDPSGDVIFDYIDILKVTPKIVTSVPDIAQSTLPVTFALSQNFPNPFNPSTTLQYGVPVTSRVKFQIYNVLGQVVAELVDGEQAAGWYRVRWNADFSTGIYFYRMEAVSKSDPANRFVQVKKMLLLR